MDSKRSSRLLVLLSLAYAIAVAVLAVLESSAVSVVAIVGAIVVGGLWAVQGVLSRRRSAPQ